MIGASSCSSVASGPLFFHSSPIFFNDASALSSNNPSRLGATLRIKLTLALFRGMISSFTNLMGSFVGSVGKVFFQNQLFCIGRQANDGMVLVSFDTRCPAPIS